MEKITLLSSPEPLETPIKGAVSIIVENPIAVLEKLGKYEFIYDYKAINQPINYIENTSVEVKSEPKLGYFSKGDIVNVVLFDGDYAIVENVNYKEPDQNLAKGVWDMLFNGFVNKKQIPIPKEYLRKVDDNLNPTLYTGANFGANPKPVFVVKPTQGVSDDVVIEENANFVLSKDFEYITGYGSSFCSPKGICTSDMSPKYAILEAGTMVTGRLFKTTTDPKILEAISDADNSMIRPIIAEKEFLAVKGYGNTGTINIPIEYLTREISNNTNNNNGTVVPVTNDNKKLLMIVGAFLVGYVLFSKKK